jgi:glucose-6-phosphate dehydrogenase assembly protein OpcA
MLEEQPQASPLPVETPREVELGRLERELRDLWSHATPSMQGPNGSGVVRACALNLVAVMWNEEHADAIADALAEVTTSHPARTILVTSHPEASDSAVRTWISVRCQKPGANRTRVCHEEIRAELRGDAVLHVDNVVLPMLLADLPTFLWWQGSLPNQSAAERAFGVLAENCERLVVDSLRLKHPQAELVAMAMMTSSSEVAPVGVLLFLGWLARRLEWQLRGCTLQGDLITFIYARLDEEISVRARRVGAGESTLTAVRFEAPGASQGSRPSRGAGRSQLASADHVAAAHRAVLRSARAEADVAAAAKRAPRVSGPTSCP